MKEAIYPEASHRPMSPAIPAVTWKTCKDDHKHA